MCFAMCAIEDSGNENRLLRIFCVPTIENAGIPIWPQYALPLLEVLLLGEEQSGSDLLHAVCSLFP